MLLRELLTEVGSWCRISTDRDWKTITTRVKDEGFSFLTITLTDFARDFQKSLEQGFVDRNSFKGFAFRAGLPRFLGGFLDLVFDRGTGVLLENPSLDAIFSIRQLTLLYKKVNLPCSKERDRKAINEYLQCESDIRVLERTGVASNRQFRVAFEAIFGRVLSVLDRNVSYNELLPKHGPGKTADHYLANAKYDQRKWTTRLQAVFPWEYYLSSSWSISKENIQPLLEVNEPGAETPVKVVTVPKTLKTPRIIAMEPACMQYMQQAVKEQLYALIEADDIASLFVGFDDQTPNQELARKGSLDGTLATLDLSMASDSVSNQLVRNALHNYPSLLRAVDATRSRKADVPGHGVIRLAKFASMGSALCFPIEAMVFTTVAMMGIANALSTSVNRTLLQKMKGQVRVFGDDIIVPADKVHSVIESLMTFGFKVNSGKSFWTGKFRESCGKDYYDGTDVTVLYFRSMFPTSRKHGKEIASIVSFRNHAYQRGLWQTVKWLDNYIEGLIPFPAVAPTSPGLGKLSFTGYQTDKIDRWLQKPFVKAAAVKARIPKSSVSGYGALLKFFLKRGELPFADRNHLVRAGRSDSVDIKIGWYPSY
jgi:hypothetical protein